MFVQHLIRTANDTSGAGNPLYMGVKNPTQAKAERVEEDMEKRGKGGKAKGKKRRAYCESIIGRE
jgi:hypothetical protein